MKKVTVWEKQVMFYMADSALWSENESSEYLNHITSINTHKTPKPRKPLLWNKFDNRQQKNKGALAETLPTEPRKIRVCCNCHHKAEHSQPQTLQKKTLLYLPELLHRGSDTKFGKERNSPLQSEFSGVISAEEGFISLISTVWVWDSQQLPDLSRSFDTRASLI